MYFSLFSSIFSPDPSVLHRTHMNEQHFYGEALSEGKMVYVIDIVSFAVDYHESQRKFCNGIILYGCTNNHNYASYLQLSSSPFLLPRQFLLYGNPPTESPIFPKRAFVRLETTHLVGSGVAQNLWHGKLRGMQVLNYQFQMKLKNYLNKPFNGAFAKASAANNPSANFSHALHYISIMIHRKAFQRYCLARHALCLFLTHRELIKGITSAEKFTVMCIRGSDKRLNACTNVSLKQ